MEDGALKIGGWLLVLADSRRLFCETVSLHVHRCWGSRAPSLIDSLNPSLAPPSTEWAQTKAGGTRMAPLRVARAWLHWLRLYWLFTRAATSSAFSLGMAISKLYCAMRHDDAP